MEALRFPNILFKYNPQTHSFCKAWLFLKMERGKVTRIRKTKAMTDHENEESYEELSYPQEVPLPRKTCQKPPEPMLLNVL